MDRTELFHRVVALRTQTFELLDEVVPAASHGAQDLDVASAAVRLQNVANELGWIERTLARRNGQAA